MPSLVNQQIGTNAPVIGSVIPSRVVMEATMTLRLLKGPATGKHKERKIRDESFCFALIDFTLSFPNRLCQVWVIKFCNQLKIWLS